MSKTLDRLLPEPRWELHQIVHAPRIPPTHFECDECFRQAPFLLLYERSWYEEACMTRFSDKMVYLCAPCAIAGGLLERGEELLL